MLLNLTTFTASKNKQHDTTFFPLGHKIIIMGFLKLHQPKVICARLCCNLMSTPGHSQFHNAQEKTCRIWPISLSELIPTTLPTKVLDTCLRSNLWVVLSVSRVFALTFLLSSQNALFSKSFKVGFSPSSTKVPSCFLWPTEGASFPQSLAHSFSSWY